jgi:hypothetical protein
VQVGKTRFTRSYSATIVAITTLFLSLVSLVFISHSTYADGPQCLILNISCTADAPTITGPSDKAYNPTSDFTWTDDQDGDNSMQFKVCISKNSDLSSATCSDPTTAQNLAISTLVPSDNEGTWYWQVTALAGGLFSNDGQSAIQSIVFHAAPGVSLLVNSSATPVPVGHDATVDVNGSVTDSQAATCSITISTDPVTTYDCGDNQWSTAGLPTKSYSITLTASDQTMTDNGQPAVLTTVWIHIDNSPPTVTIGNDGNLAPADGGMTPDVTATDDSPDNLQYAWSDNGQNPQQLDYDHTVAIPTFTATVNGDYTFTLVVTDIYGNATTKQFHFTYGENKLVSNPSGGTLTPVATTVTPTTSTIVTGGTASSVSTTTTSRRSDDDDSTPAAASTLGASTVGSAVTASKDPAPIIATHQGWQILGILWYWWGVLIIALVAGYMIVRRIVVRR